MPQPASLDPHLTGQQMLAYRGRALSPGDRRLADTHLAGCGLCRRALLASLGPIALPLEAASLVPPLHLDYDQLAALADGTLAPSLRDRAEQHLLLCAACARELEGLRQLDLQLATPAPQPAAQTPAKAAAQAASKAPLFQRLAAFFTAPGRLRDLAFSAALAVCGVVLLTSVGPGSGTAASAVRGAARLIDLSAQPFTGVHLGGYLLIAIGAALLAYSFLRRR